MFFGNIVIINPSTILSRNHSLSTQNISVPSTVKLLQDMFNLLLSVGVRSLHSPASEHLICVMMMVMTATGTPLTMLVMMLMVVLMMMVVTTAFTILTMLMMVLMVVVVLMMVLVVMLVMVMVMTVTATLAIFAMVVVMFVVMVMLMIMLMTATFLAMMMVVLVVMVVLMHTLQHLLHHIFQLVSTFDCLKYSLTLQLCQRSGNYGSFRIMLSDEFHCQINFVL